MVSSCLADHTLDGKEEFRGRSSGLLEPVCAILAQLAVLCSLQRGLSCP